MQNIIKNTEQINWKRSEFVGKKKRTKLFKKKKVPSYILLPKEKLRGLMVITTKTRWFLAQAWKEKSQISKQKKKLHPAQNLVKEKKSAKNSQKKR